jgi:hypothetical protein
MRTKTLLIAAAAMAAGIMVASAQTYSQNVVGYVNINLASGYTAIANQMDFDGTGTNNTLFTVFGTNLPAPTTVYAWSTAGNTFNFCTWSSTKSGKAWSGDTNDVQLALQPGKGVFVNCPLATNITVVGTVLQSNTIPVNTVVLGSGYNFASSAPPLSGALQTNLNYIPTVGDAVYIWDPVAQSYDANSPYTYASTKSGAHWTPVQPVAKVGQSVFIQTSGTTWTNTLIVQ